MSFPDPLPSYWPPRRVSPRLRHLWEPPETELPGIVQIETLRFEGSENAAIAVTGISAYSAGYEIFVIRRVRPGVPESSEDLSHARWHLPAGRKSFQIALRFPGGSEVIGRESNPEVEPDGPILRPNGGYGTEYSSFLRYWAWPLPPEGTLEFVCQWPMFEITETRVSIDTQVILDAARRSVRLWPEEESPLP